METETRIRYIVITFMLNSPLQPIGKQRDAARNINLAFSHEQKLRICDVA